MSNRSIVIPVTIGIVGGLATVYVGAMANVVLLRNSIALGLFLPTIVFAVVVVVTLARGRYPDRKRLTHNARAWLASYATSFVISAGLWIWLLYPYKSLAGWD